jgi:CubicO group peptidase (beta-lactamase class C family)
LTRFILRAALALATALVAVPPASLAQDAPSSAAASLPSAPVPYVKLRPQRRPAARTAPRTTAPVAPAVAAAVGIAGAVPVVAGQPTTASGARLAAGQALPPAELEAFVDGAVREAMGRDHIAGVTVSIVQNGQVVLKKGYGFAALQPRRRVDPDRTLFRVGSISKTFTWIAVMKEVEAGRMRLTAPVNLYLPEPVRIRDQGYRRDVEVRNLMDHSAGFEDRMLGHLMESSPDRVRPLQLYLRQERPDRVSASGVVSNYSNYGAALAGQAVAYASGQPFETYAETRIFRPLGMSRTTFREPREAKAGLPEPMPTALAGQVSNAYRWTPSGFERRGFEYIGQIAPSGSASSTAGDMARYMIAVLNGGTLGGATVYGPQTARLFRTPLRPTPPGINSWAHGFVVHDLPGGYRGFGHDGATLFFYSSMVTVPQLGLGIFISANTDTAEPFVGRFAEELVRQFYAAPRDFPRAGSPELAASADTFSGYYLTTRRAYSGLEEFVGGLTGGALVQVTPDGRLVTRLGDRPTSWVPDGPLGQGRFVAFDGDQRLAFHVEDGEATSFIPASGAERFERAPAWRRPIVLGLLAGLTGFAAIATLAGLVLRNRRDFRENMIQARAGLLQNIQAGLWLTSLGLFGVWLTKTGDVAQIVYRWPGALLITASACALVAALLTIATLIAVPAVWRGGRRVDSWTALRKAAFTTTVIIYAAYSVLLGLWGALSPWSG